MFSGSCDPLYCNPSGPSIPFGTWYLALFDVARILCVIASLVLIGRIGVAWRRSRAHGGQRDRYLALALFAFVAATTEASHMGDVASYRLVVTVVALGFAQRGLFRFPGETLSVPKDGS